MKICSKELNQCVTLEESNCYKYSSRSVLGKVDYFVGARDENGKIIREKITEADFKDIEYRLVDCK
ncbi:MAG: hypothetical protein WCR55_10230 [Lentisphaerota bacterium]